MSEQERIADQMMAALDEFATALGTINSEETATAAVPKMESALNRYNELSTRAKGLPEAAADIKEKIIERFGEHDEKINLDIQRFVNQLHINPNIRSIVEPTIRQYASRMQHPALGWEPPVSSGDAASEGDAAAGTAGGENTEGGNAGDNKAGDNNAGGEGSGDENSGGGDSGSGNSTSGG